jgi:hypothetical protein
VIEFSAPTGLTDWWKRRKTLSKAWAFKQSLGIQAMGRAFR